MQRYLTLLDSVRGLVVARASLGRDQFRAYSETITLQETYPAIMGLGVVLNCTLDRKEGVARLLREQGYANPSVWPATDHIRSCPLILLEPQNPSNLSLMGYDLFSDADIRKAMERAEEGRIVAATGPVTLSGQDGRPAWSGMVLVTPIHRQELTSQVMTGGGDPLLGHIVCALNYSDLFGELVGKEAERMLQVQVFLGNDVKEQSRLYPTSEDPDRPAARGAPVAIRSLRVADGIWTIRYTPAPEFATRAAGGSGLFISMLGSCVSLLLFTATRTQTKAQRAAEAHAEELQMSEDLLRESEHHFNQLANAMPQIVWEAGPDGKVDFFNRRWFEFTGLEPGTDGKMNLRRILHPEDWDPCVRTWRDCAERGEPYEIEYRLRRASDAGYRWHLGRAVPVRDAAGDIVKWYGTCTDIHDRKQAEVKYAELNAELDRHVRERTAQLEVALKELESFSYSVSHDLRSPLRGIDGWSLALLEDYGERLDEQGREYLGTVRSETQRMGQLIDDLLNLSRVTRSEMNLVEVDLGALARVVMDELKRRNPDRKVDFRIEGGMVTRGDASLCRVMLENLLGNAWKYTQKTGSPRIEFGSREEDGRLVFLVRDNGAGFNLEKAQKLFAPFQRFHSPSDFPGTGVGLATVHRIVHRHGGTIWAESTAGQGATFYFTLTPPVHERKSHTAG